MKQISSLDLYFLNNEFKEYLENSRIETFYQEEDIFYMKVYTKGKGHFFLTNKVSKYIYLSDKRDDTSTVPKSFIQYLRKFLKNGIIQKIEQVENERILKIKISKKKTDTEEFEIFYLILELFANGNIIITDNNFKIKNSLEKKKFKDRTVMVRDVYQLPPQKEISIFTLKKDKFSEELNKSDLSIVKFLAIKLGIGGKFSEEIIFNSKIDKNKNSIDITKKEVDTILKFSQKLIESKIKSIGIYNEKQELIDFSPIDLKSIKAEKREFKNFNELIKEYFLKFKIDVDKKEKEFQFELKRLSRRIKTQEKKREGIFENYEKYNSIGNKIYENYSVIEELLNSIHTVSKDKGWEYVLEKVKNDQRLSKIIKKINPDKNEIILELK